MKKDNIVSNFNISDSLDSLESQINKVEKNKNNKPIIQPKIEQPAKELAFVGCYAVAKKAKSQLKISELENSAGKTTGKLVFQMKEPRSARRVWDDADSLEFVSLEESSLYFDINVSNIDRIVARPDRLFVLAHVNKGSDQNSVGQSSVGQDSVAPNDSNSNDDEVADSEYLVYFSDGSDSVAAKPLDKESVNSTDNSTDSSETETIKIKNIPKKPNTNVMYPVKCDKRNVNILKGK